MDGTDETMKMMDRNECWDLDLVEELEIDVNDVEMLDMLGIEL